MRGRWSGRVLYRTISTSEKVSSLIDKDALSAALYFMLLPHLDDLGRHEASPRTVKAIACPLVGDLTPDRVKRSLRVIREMNLCVLYRNSGREYVQYTPYQCSVRNKAVSALPGPDDFGSSMVEQPKSRKASTDRERAEKRALDAKAVYAHWRTYHPRAAEQLRRGSPDEAKILDRLGEFDLDALIEAIDGNHVDPHCCGQNKDGREYHSLDLIFRSAGQVTRYREALETHHKAPEAPEDRSGRDLAAEVARRAQARKGRQ